MNTELTYLAYIQIETHETHSLKRGEEIGFDGIDDTGTLIYWDGDAVMLSECFDDKYLDLVDDREVNVFDDAIKLTAWSTETQTLIDKYFERYAAEVDASPTFSDADAKSLKFHEITDHTGTYSRASIPAKYDLDAVRDWCKQQFNSCYVTKIRGDWFLIGNIQPRQKWEPTDKADTLVIGKRPPMAPVKKRAFFCDECNREINWGHEPDWPLDTGHAYGVCPNHPELGEQYEVVTPSDDDDEAF